MVTPRPAALRSDLTHPSMIAAVALLLVNDHVLKGSGWLPGWLTGKLSDLAGLYFFPVLLVVLLEATARRAGRSLARPPIALLATTLTGLVFAALKLSPGLAAWVSQRFVIVCDPTDLIALPMLVASHHHLTRHTPRKAAPRWVQAVTVILSALASMATSRPHVQHGFALWQTVSSDNFVIGCAEVEGWVARSGKQGLGVTLHFQSTDPACVVQLLDAHLALPGQQIAVSLALPLSLQAGLTSEPASAPDQPPPPGAFVYLPFAFDNNEVWNRGDREATLLVRLRSGRYERSWSIPLRYVDEGYHPPEQESSIPPSHHRSPVALPPPPGPVNRSFAQPPPGPSPAPTGGTP